MKYNININQKALADSGLGIKDCAIIDYLIYYCNSANPNVEKFREEGYTWVDYSKLIIDMPLLEIKSTQSITPRMKKIEKEGYILTKHVVRGGKKRLLVKLPQKIDSLLVEPLTTTRETNVNNNTIDNNTILPETKVSSDVCNSSLNSLSSDCAKEIKKQSVKKEDIKEVVASYERAFSTKTGKRAIVENSDRIVVAKMMQKIPKDVMLQMIIWYILGTDDYKFTKHPNLKSVFTLENFNKFRLTN